MLGRSRQDSPDDGGETMFAPPRHIIWGRIDDFDNYSTMDSTLGASSGSGMKLSRRQQTAFAARSVQFCRESHVSDLGLDSRARTYNSANRLSAHVYQNNVKRDLGDVPLKDDFKDFTRDILVTLEDGTVTRHPSLGSKRHTNSCKPCRFAYTASSCDNHLSCEFCHFKHSRKNLERKVAPGLGGDIGDANLIKSCGAAAAVPPAAKRREYSITIDRRGGIRLGVEVDHRDGRTLLIDAVTGGLVGKWNTENPSLAVKAGDRIVEINNIRGNVLQLVEECKKNKVLIMVVKAS